MMCEWEGNGALMLSWPLSPQGIYVFAVYFIMHNQLCWPTKASYTVEMSGHEGPDSSYQGGGPTGSGGDINKSTQNLISAMEEVKLVVNTLVTRMLLLFVFPICFGTQLKIEQNFWIITAEFTNDLFSHST